MTDDELITALRTTTVANNAAAREGVLASAREHQVASRPSRKKKWVIAGTLVAAAITFSPAGQSLAGEIGDLVGVGDAPSDPVPTDGDRTDSSEVIATGRTPSGVDFELVQRSSHLGDEEPGSLTSAYLSYPSRSIAPQELEVLNAGVLAKLGEDKPLRPWATVAPTGIGDAEGLIVTAISADPIESVRVKYDDRGSSKDATVTSGAFVPRGTGEAELPAGLTFSAAFIPAATLGAPDHDPSTDDQSQEVDDLSRALAHVQVLGLDPDGDLVTAQALEDVPNLATALALSR